jgi:hypothetical protein
MENLTPIEQKEVDFQDRKITAVLVQDADGRENVYVPLRPLVEGMGLSWSGARERVLRTTALEEVCMSVRVTRTDIPEGSRQPKHSDYLSIPISHLNGFLFGVNEHRVKSELKPLIIAYQRECYKVLFEAFNGIESMIRFYKGIGHDAGWIEKRVKKHEISTDLNDLWLLHGVPIEQHAQLLDILNKGVFGLTTSEHKQFKQLPKNASLHDNMTRMELLISAIADEGAIVLSQEENPQTYEENEQIAKTAASFGKKTKEGFEEMTGSKILSTANNSNKKKRPLFGGNK